MHVIKKGDFMGNPAASVGRSSVSPAEQIVTRTDLEQCTLQGDKPLESCEVKFADQRSSIENDRDLKLGQCTTMSSFTVVDGTTLPTLIQSCDYKTTKAHADAMMAKKASTPTPPSEPVLTIGQMIGQSGIKEN